MYMCVTQPMYGGQKAACRSWFSPFTLGLVGLAAKTVISPVMLPARRIVFNI